MTQSTTTGQLRKLTSPVWQSFERNIVNGVVTAKCVHCNKVFSVGSKNGTSHLRDHLKLRCNGANQKVDIRQSFLQASKKADGTTSLGNYNFNQEASRKELATMVILHEYPLSIVDHIGFRRFVGSLNPSFKIISRNTLRSDIMKMFLCEKANLRKMFDNNKSKIAITTDMWTASNQKRGYMVVTAHYIDQFWVLHNKTLRFAYIPCPHTKDALTQVLLDTLNGYHIEEKISCLVVDNCSTNDAMVNVLKPRLGEDSLILKGKFLHMRCTAHILNLIVQDGLNVIGEGRERVRDCVSYWVGTPKRIEMFESKVKSVKGEDARKISLDCKTRWNSTFLMLQSVLPYKDVFASIHRQNSKLKFTLPTQTDWDLAALVCEKLVIFHELTKLISGRRYPTSNLFFREVCEIKIALTSWLKSNNPVIKGMAMKMSEKYEKYWMSINQVLAIATILDPRNKLECVECYYEDIYGNKAEIEIMMVKNTLYELLHEYEDNLEGCHSITTETIELGIQEGDCHKKVDKWSRVKKTKKRKFNVKSELDYYLEEGALPEDDNFNILQYWKVELKYPTLKRIAKDILAIPASTVASESAFSMGGRVVSEHRSRLVPSTVEALMCLQNWILGEFSSDTSLDTIEACATIGEDHDTVIENTVGNEFENEVHDLDSGDDSGEDFMGLI